MNAQRSTPTPQTAPQPDLPPDRSRQSVLRQLAALQPLTTEQLKQKWRDLYCSEPPAYNRQFLIRRLAYRIQEFFYGGLSQAAREKLRRTAESDPLARLNKHKQPDAATDDDQAVSIPEGTRFIRLWKGQRYEVVMGPQGYEFEGIAYRSLSAIAKLITGSHWNGRAFFGVKAKPRATKKAKRKRS